MAVRLRQMTSKFRWMTLCLSLLRKILKHILKSTYRKLKKDYEQIKNSTNQNPLMRWGKKKTKTKMLGDKTCICWGKWKQKSTNKETSLRHGDKVDFLLFIFCVKWDNKMLIYIIFFQFMMCFYIIIHFPGKHS
jgi:hypothetical protein